MFITTKQGLSQEEMERRFKALESKIDLSGGIMVNGERLGSPLHGARRYPSNSAWSCGRLSMTWLLLLGD
jgi:hypothetical protein